MKLIPLTGEAEALVDNEDYEYLMQWKWQNRKGYGVRTAWDGKRYHPVSIHRTVMEAQKGQIVDHIDRNPLNNQKSNLRFTTTAKNIANSKMSKRNKTGMRGVSFWKGSSFKYAACIVHNRKTVHLGYFNDLKQAGLAYNMASRNLFGESAYQNEIT